jgi:hypothetical protein
LLSARAGLSQIGSRRTAQVRHNTLAMDVPLWLFLNEKLGGVPAPRGSKVIPSLR